MIRVKSNHCAIVPIDDPDITPGGIIIPEEAKDRTDQGIVKYVGPKCEFVEPLDYVIYGGYNGQLLVLNRGEPNEERLIILSEDKLISKVAFGEIDSLTVPGLYFKSRDELLPASYEVAVSFLGMAIRAYTHSLGKQKWDVRGVNEKSKKNQHRVMAETRE